MLTGESAPVEKGVKRLGVLSSSIWIALGYSFSFAIVRMDTVLIIACPHALGLAAPLVVAVSHFNAWSEEGKTVVFTLKLMSNPLLKID